MRTYEEGRPRRPSRAEREGFEPSTHLSARTRFPVALLRPLGHLSEPAQGIARSGPGRSAPIESAPIDDPGTSKRPGNPGIQYVGIPQFQDVGDQCTEQFAAVIRGRGKIKSALANCENIASAAVGAP